MGTFLQKFVDESAGSDLSLFYCLLCAVSHVILSLQPLHSLGQSSIIAPLQQLIDRSSVGRHLMNSLILLIPLTHGAVHPPVTFNRVDFTAPRLPLTAWCLLANSLWAKGDILVAGSKQRTKWRSLPTWLPTLSTGRVLRRLDLLPSSPDPTGYDELLLINFLNGQVRRLSGRHLINNFIMHKNNFVPKTLEGNWFEDRCTDEYNSSNKSATYMKHPRKPSHPQWQASSRPRPT